ncbi:MAG: NUDIX domain-containing protein [Thiohalocapsa sp.]
MTKLATLSAGIVPVRVIDDVPHVLVLRCYNYWDFPKGEVEPGEDPWAAAQREFSEETGLGVPRRLQRRSEGAQTEHNGQPPSVETERYGRGKVARYYIALAPDGDVSLPISPELGFPEHHEYRWATFPEAHALFNERLRRVLAWAGARLGEEWGEQREGAD